MSRICARHRVREWATKKSINKETIMKAKTHVKAGPRIKSG